MKWGKWFKIGSGECSNFPFIECLANFKLPIILSTGMNKIEDIKKSVKILKKKIKYALLQVRLSIQRLKIH